MPGVMLEMADPEAGQFRRKSGCASRRIVGNEASTPCRTLDKSTPICRKPEKRKWTFEWK